MRTALLWTAFASLLGLACGGGRSAPGLAQGPSGLTVRYDPSARQVFLAWTPPPGPVESYDLEGALRGRPWSPLVAGGIGGQYDGATLDLDQALPELDILDFGVRGLEKGVYTAYSNTAELAVPITPPCCLSAQAAPGGQGIHVSWGTVSQVADAYVLERAEAGAGGAAASPWETLPLAAPMASDDLDLAVQESRVYLYRVTARLGAQSSAAAGPSAPVRVPPLPPSGFTAQPLPGGVALAWTNQSRTATQIQVFRSPAPAGAPSGLVATLPGSAASYQDEGLALMYYQYNLTVSDGAASTLGPTLTAAPSNPPGAPALVQGTLAFSGSRLCGAVLAPGGTWALATQDAGIEVPQVNGFPWPAWSFPGPGASSLVGLLLDAGSLPRAVYASTTYQPQATRVGLAAFDGSAWQDSTLLPGASVGALDPVACALDASGTWHVLLEGSDGTVEGLVHAFGAAGALALEPILADGQAQACLGGPGFCLDAAGTPHVLVQTASGSVEFWKPAGGAWTSQPLTDAGAAAEPYAFQGGVWADPSTAWVFDQRFSPDAQGQPATTLAVISKVLGAWQAPVTVATLPASAAYLGSAALSPDGSRQAAAVVSSNGVFLLTSSAQGWIPSLLPWTAPNPPTFLKVGFDGAGKLHVLLQPPSSSSSAVEFREP